MLSEAQMHGSFWCGLIAESMGGERHPDPVHDTCGQGEIDYKVKVWATMKVNLRQFNLYNLNEAKHETE